MSALLVEAVRAAIADSEPVRIRGGGTKDFYGQKLEGRVVETTTHCGIVGYEPSELVLTARSGTSLAEIHESLQAKGQYLPFEPPEFGAGTTLGGMVASGLAGPGRMVAGSVRDYVLGAELIDGQAQVLRFGGQVMKNVAGYDVARALAGSLGTLGILLQVSLKVLPRPQTSLSLRFEEPAAQALERMTLWSAQPLPITAAAWCDGQLSLRLAGSHTAVLAAAAQLGGERIEAGEADSFWRALRDQQLPFFDRSKPLWRLALPNATPPLDLPGAQCIEWGGMLRWLITDLPAATVRAAVASVGGHATLFRANAAEKAAAGVFTPRSAAVALIEARLKALFDPHDIFNRGRINVR